MKKFSSALFLSTKMLLQGSLVIILTMSMYASADILINAEGFEFVVLGPTGSDTSFLSAYFSSGSSYVTANPYQGLNSLNISQGESCRVSTGSPMTGNNWYTYDMYLRAPDLATMKTGTSWSTYVGLVWKYNVDGSGTTLMNLQYVNINGVAKLYMGTNGDSNFSYVGTVTPNSYSHLIIAINPDPDNNSATTDRTVRVWLNTAACDNPTYQHTWTHTGTSNQVGSMFFLQWTGNVGGYYVDSFVLANNLPVYTFNWNFDQSQGAGAPGQKGIWSALTGFQNMNGSQFIGIPIASEGTVYQWGAPYSSAFSVAIDTSVSHLGLGSVYLKNIDTTAKAGLYKNITLTGGNYQLGLWVRADGGEGQIVIRMDGGSLHTFTVTSNWQYISAIQSLSSGSKNREFDIFVSGTIPVWVDNVTLQLLPTNGTVSIVSDTRPVQPKTLLFSYINVNYLKDTVGDWAARGFKGFIFGGILNDPHDNIWETDGNASTTGINDALEQEVSACNAACASYGITDNFIKVALYVNLPDYFDDNAWATIRENMRQCAIFAQLSGCKGIALDTEYIAPQYQLTWTGWTGYDADTLKAKARAQWKSLIDGMLAVYPDMTIVTFPDGIGYYNYGPLYQEMFLGILSSCKENSSIGGLHMLSEATYQWVDSTTVRDYITSTNTQIKNLAPSDCQDYWTNYCSVGGGTFPLGYYRKVFNGATYLGMSGKVATYGNQIVGSYADKTEWYSVNDFNAQLAGARTSSKKYVWVYSNGEVFYQMTDAQVISYANNAHKVPFSEKRLTDNVLNVLLPTISNLSQYVNVLQTPKIIVVSP